MSDVFRTAENRILAKRVKGKFTNPTEDIANVRVLSGGVASVAGQVYDSDTGGYRPGAVVEAVNVGTKGNARYVAKVANGGLDEAAIRRIVKNMLGDFLHSNDFISAIVAPTTPAKTLTGIFRDSVGPISGSGNTVTFTIPNTVVPGDFLVGFVAMERSETIIDLGLGTGGNGFYYNTGTMDTYDFYVDAPVVCITPTPGGLVGVPWEDGYQGFSMQSLSRIAREGDAGLEVSFGLLPRDPSDPHTSGQEYIFTFYILKREFAANTSSFDFSVGQGIHYYDTSGSVDGYYLTTETGSTDLSTGNPAETGGIVVTKENEVVFYVCVSRGEVSVTASANELEVCDAQNGEISMFVSCRFYPNVGYSPNRIFYQSAAAYSVAEMLGIETY